MTISPEEESDEEEKDNKKTEKTVPVKKVSQLGAKKLTDSSSPSLKKALPVQRGSVMVNPSNSFGAGSSGGTRSSLKPGTNSTATLAVAKKSKHILLEINVRI